MVLCNTFSKLLFLICDQFRIYQLEIEREGLKSKFVGCLKLTPPPFLIKEV